MGTKTLTPFAISLVTSELVILYVSVFAENASLTTGSSWQANCVLLGWGLSVFTVHEEVLLYLI